MDIDLKDLETKLPKGTVIAVYRDDGPSGICGQSMEITCPHTAIHIFKSEEEFWTFVRDNPGRGGKNSQLHYVVVRGPGLFETTLGTSIHFH